MATCAGKGCTKWPSFGAVGGPRLYCAAHKRPGDVCLKRSAECIFPGCAARPSFGDPADGGRLYCARHKRPSDVLLVARAACAAEGCATRRRYGPPGGRPRHCARHRAPGEVHLDQAKRKRGSDAPPGGAAKRRRVGSHPGEPARADDPDASGA